MFKIAISQRFKTSLINHDIYCRNLVETQNYNLGNINSNKYYTLLMQLFYQHQFLQKHKFYDNITFIIYKHSFKNIAYWIYINTNLFLKIYFGSIYLLTTDLMNIIIL